MAFNLGDRVVIVDRKHPWWGRAGVIDGTFDRADLTWTVKLDGSYMPSVAVADSDIRRV